MSRRFATTARWIGLLALCLGMITALTPTPAAAATPGGMVGWGSDSNGALCLGSLTNRQVTPTAGTGATAANVVAVAAGGYFSLALKADGTIFACGLNRFYGTLGIGVEDANNHPTPQQVVGVAGATAITVGQYHSLAVVGGGVVTWGKNANGELGQGTTDALAHPTPAAIGGLSGVKAVAAGINSSFAIKTDDTLWSWGNNGAGQLGLGTAGGTHTTPQQVFLSPGVPLLAKSVAAGEQHTAVVATDGKLYTFGGNGEGERGSGATDSSTHPTPAQVAALGTDNVAVASGYRHIILLKSGGTVWTWGQNSNGQLGRGGSGSPDPTPAAVAGLAGVTALGSGQDQSLALLADGTVRAWGRGTGGELGNGGASNSAIPVQASGLTNAVAISTGPYAQQSLAVKTTPVSAIVSISPLTLQFPNQLVGTTSAPQLVRLSNSGGQPLVVSGITIVGTNPGDFAQTNTCSAPVAPTGSCTISVTFTPTVAGARAATLRIVDNAGDSPQQVGLGGTGVIAQPPFNLIVTFAGTGSGTVGVTAANISQPSPNHYLIPQVAVATLIPQASNSVFTGWKLDGVFTGWKLDGVFVGWASPLTLTMNIDHTMEATFVPIPVFGDVPGGKAYTDAVLQLAARDIIRGCVQTATSRLYCPADLTLRAQMAALIARASGWDTEDHNNAFPDRGPIDDNLWRNVGTVAFYNVARGYTDGTYNPTGEVLYAQTISLITRAMITKGYWDLQADDGGYPNILPTSGHRQDLATFVHYAGALPDYPDTSGPFTNWDQPSTRAWFARALWQALNSYWSVDRVP